jgi:hypothetical protein
MVVHLLQGFSARGRERAEVDYSVHQVHHLVATSRQCKLPEQDAMRVGEPIAPGGTTVQRVGGHHYDAFLRLL